MNTNISSLQPQQFLEYLDSILSYWSNLKDIQKGGFIGQVDFQEKIQLEADKGAVLHARILWSFAAAYPITQQEEHLAIAHYVYDYLQEHFRNKEQEGVYWSVDANGNPKETKNQIYALAFVIYGLAAYYKISRNKAALDWAVVLFNQIEKYSYDPVHEGYLEAFTYDWKELTDLRLSDKDANEAKTMNTHLHIVEAYANLYSIWPSSNLKHAIQKLLYTIDTYFIDKKNKHLKLFFDEKWQEKPNVISYGHDIEAAWLLLWCAQVIEDKHLIELYEKNALLLAEGTLEGIDEDGGLWYERESLHGALIKEKHWWPQAELWIGMQAAFTISKEERFRDVMEKNILFTEKFLMDKQYGEWLWGIDAAYTPILKDKAGFWKCPYHNTRACIELYQRLTNV